MACPPMSSWRSQDIRSGRENHEHHPRGLAGHGHARARGRAHRGRGPVRHRRRLPSSGRGSRHLLRSRGGARGQRRDMGPVPVPGGPVGLGHVHPRLSLPPMERLQVDRGRRGDPALPPGDCGGLRRGSPDQLPHPRRAGRVVQPGRPLDRDARAHRVGRADQADLRLPVPVLRLLPIRPGLHAVLARRLRPPRLHDRPGSRRDGRA